MGLEDLTPALAPGGLRSLSEIDAIPDSAVYYWLAESFADPWTDDVLGQNMSVSGLSASTISGEDSVSGDGANDSGQANIGNWNPAGTAAIELAIATNGDGEPLGKKSGSNEQRIVAGIGDTGNANGTTAGVPAIHWRDPNDNRLSVEGETNISDGNLHTIIWGKEGDKWSNGDYYITVDGNDESLSINFNENDDHQNLDQLDLSNFAFFAANDNGSIVNHINADVVGFAFHDTDVRNATILD